MKCSYQSTCTPSVYMMICDVSWIRCSTSILHGRFWSMGYAQRKTRLRRRCCIHGICSHKVNGNEDHVCFTLENTCRASPIHLANGTDRWRNPCSVAAYMILMPNKWESSRTMYISTQSIAMRLLHTFHVSGIRRYQNTCSVAAYTVLNLGK